jgi:hypothetical protein
MCSTSIGRSPTVFFSSSISPMLPIQLSIGSLLTVRGLGHVAATGVDQGTGPSQPVLDHRFVGRHAGGQQWGLGVGQADPHNHALDGTQAVRATPKPPRAMIALP